MELRLIKLPITYVIDFNNLKEGSDLWLFAKTSNLSEEGLNNVTVLLTPNFDGKVWYEKKDHKIIIYAVSSDSQIKNCKSKIENCSLEVSYRLTAPRFDHAQWPNTSTAKHEGFNLDYLLHKNTGR